jgi:hypothetical protein
MKTVYIVQDSKRGILGVFSSRIQAEKSITVSVCNQSKINLLNTVGESYILSYVNERHEIKTRHFTVSSYPMLDSIVQL